MNLVMQPHLRVVGSGPEHDFRVDLQAALGAGRRRISPKYFYDAHGSQLFDAICELPEYYPTRTELALLGRHAGEMAALAGPDAELVEFGAGSLRKVRLLLDALVRPAGYVPIDISGEHLARAAAQLRQDYPALAVHPVVADYTQPLLLPNRTGGPQRAGIGMPAVPAGIKRDPRSTWGSATTRRPKNEKLSAL